MNTGEKDLKVAVPTALMFRNGTQGPHPLTALGKDIARGNKALIARVEDAGPWVPRRGGWRSP